MKNWFYAKDIKMIHHVHTNKCYVVHKKKLMTKILLIDVEDSFCKSQHPFEIKWNENFKENKG